MDDAGFVGVGWVPRHLTERGVSSFMLSLKGTCLLYIDPDQRVTMDFLCRSAGSIGNPW